VSYSIATVTGATSYTWSAPTGYSIASGQGTTAITVDFTACTAASGNISVTANTACVSGTAKTLAITVNTLAAPGTITGTASIIPPQTGVSYSVAAVTGATSYNWTLPAGATITSGSGTNSIMVDFACGASSGTITVSATNICVTTAVGPAYTLTTTGLAVPGTITGLAAVVQEALV